VSDRLLTRLQFRITTVFRCAFVLATIGLSLVATIGLALSVTVPLAVAFRIVVPARPVPGA
jgi:cytochrome bd-type quinol oxidase subunit 1